MRDKRYECMECGKHFTTEEADYKHECIGEFWGAPAYTDYVACPKCGCTMLETIEDVQEDDEE